VIIREYLFLYYCDFRTAMLTRFWGMWKMCFQCNLNIDEKKKGGDER